MVLKGLSSGRSPDSVGLHWEIIITVTWFRVSSPCKPICPLIALPPGDALLVMDWALPCDLSTSSRRHVTQTSGDLASVDKPTHGLTPPEGRT
ncbi:hypothetical protein E2C01_066448 [Portunus trituberculatus]|uniref:Uncharacterized protein n=1 Tax=Portunus trituberculatus TaxID=210409 RepID=A0A5B7HUP7_PORTR|nr:hypothetical protein [Portunus trituberculatus]